MESPRHITVIQYTTVSVLCFRFRFRLIVKAKALIGAIKADSQPGMASLLQRTKDTCVLTGIEHFSKMHRAFLFILIPFLIHA